MIRRLQITLLALFVGVWAMASETSVKNADGVEIWYDFDSNTMTASVTYRGEAYYTYYNEYIGNVVIPSKVTYEDEEYSVTKIGDWVFYGCNSLTSITIPESVTEIGEMTFILCSSLTSITLHEGLTEIGESAFYGCSSLTSITIPESVTEIGSNAFLDCSSLTSITIPKGVTEIGEDAFYGCSSLTSITIPEGVTEIGDYAFSFCSSLTSITIPESVTSIGEDAFQGCSSLTSVTIPKNVTSIGEDAFSGCSSLTSITIPKGVTSIGDNVFRDCSSLTSITIPEGLTEIGDGAFEDCSSLTSITIPEGVISIGEYAFRGCDRLYEVYNKSNLTITAGSSENGGVAYHAKNVYTDESGESKLKTVGDYIFYVDEDNIELFAYIGDETAITLPSDYEGKNYKIGDNAFRDCSSLTSITLPESVTEIGEGAFAYCSGLTNVTIGEGVTKIGDNAFVGCSNHDVYNRSKLYLTLGSEENGYVAYHANNVNNIYFETTDSYIFYVKEDDVELIKHIGGFDGADVMINEYVEDENIYSTDFSDGLSLIGWGGSATRTVVNEEMVLTNPEASDYWAVQFAYDHVEPFVAGRKYVISFKVKGSVAGTISAGLQNINGYTSAGEFGGIDVTTDWKEVRLTCTCTDGAATRLVFSVGTFVGDLYIDDFRFCSLFYKLSLPAKYKERVYDISRNAFEDDTYMTEIEIPEGVMAIGKDAMKGTALYEDESNWENGLLYVDGCLVAAKSSEVSELCVIEDGVRIIADNTFENITTLKNVIISADVRRIGNAAFNDCSGLTSITSMSTTPPEIGNKETFCNVDKSIPLYVPAESVEAYKSAEGWKEFTNILPIQADGNPISEVKADNITVRSVGNSIIVTGTDNYTVYSISGQSLGKVTNVERGIYIVVAEGKSYKVAIK